MSPLRCHFVGMVFQRAYFLPEALDIAQLDLVEAADDIGQLRQLDRIQVGLRSQPVQIRDEMKS